MPHLPARFVPPPQRQRSGLRTWYDITREAARSKVSSARVWRTAEA
ncbi:MAG TPA: hypothetical protein VMT19_00905 [Thermoanaerobaculaceae bacterium]|nr:hypothetical protein [Thermoanaerobaculaceae bacterium]